MNAPQSQYAQALQSLYNQLKESGSGGNVDLTNRPRVSPQDMSQVGYDIGDSYATTYTSTYSNPDGTQALNITPIQASNGQLNDIYEQEFINQYADDLLSGRRKDDLGLQIGDLYQGNDAIQRASDDAVRQHNLQEQYYALMKLAGLK